MTKKQKNICLIGTVYSLFLYILIKGYNKEDIFIFTSWFPKEVSKNFKHISLPLIVFRYGAKMYQTDSIKGILKNITGYITYFYTYIKLRILLFIKTFNKDTEVYGHANNPFSFMFFENENSYIIEDGLYNYTPYIRETHKINPIIDKLLHVCGIYFLSEYEGLGSHKNIKKVYLTNNYDHPLIKDKVEVINIEEQWNKFSEDEKNQILNLFNFNLDKNYFNDNNTMLLLTQPFFEDNISTLEYELKIYEDFIEIFKDCNIVIKPHPRDEKNYAEIFPDIEVMDKSFPIELLNLIGIKPKVVCTIVSNAVLNFKDSEIYIYEGELESERMDDARKNLIKLIQNRKNE